MIYYDTENMITRERLLKRRAPVLLHTLVGRVGDAVSNKPHKSMQSVLRDQVREGEYRLCWIVAVKLGGAAHYVLVNKAGV